MDSNSKIIKEEPLVNILMLTYNRADFIGEAIYSVIYQTYKNWELIIIDDGSTDNTEFIVNNIKDERIKYIKHKENLGLNHRRKESLTYIKGKYFAVLDSDDIWLEKNKLKEQVIFLELNKDYSLIGTYIKLLDKNSKLLGLTTYEYEDEKIRNKLLIRNQFAHSSVLIRSSILNKTKGYQVNHLAEDFDLFLQLGNVSKFGNIPKYYTGYRVHNNSFKKQKLLMVKAVLKIIKKYKGDYPNYYLAILKAYVRILLYKFI